MSSELLKSVFVSGANLDVSGCDKVVKVGAILRSDLTFINWVS